MRAQRTALKRTTETRPAQLSNSGSVWLLLTCDRGHLKKMFRRGDWSDARKLYGRKNATVECGRCAKLKSSEGSNAQTREEKSV